MRISTTTTSTRISTTTTSTRISTTRTTTIDRPPGIVSSPAVDLSCRIIFGLGSNLGQRRAHLRWALDELADVLGSLEIAPLYRSRPISAIEQPDYLNTVAIARRPTSDDPSPRQLLRIVKRLELRAGRRTGPRDGPRPLDIDLLLYGDRVVDEPALRPPEDEAPGDGALVLPHPRLRSRRFVLAPLADLARDLCLPPDGARVGDLLSGLGEQEVERLPWDPR